MPQTARTGADFDFAGYLEAITARELRLTLEEIRSGSRRHESMDQLTRQVAGLYAERFLLELVQNAYDGTGPSGSAHIVIRLDYRAGPHGTLYVANGGRGFTPENVDAITNPALSSKHPGQDLGHKGLGFRSVATISDDPQIYSTSGTGTKTQFDGFCFRFARLEDERAVLQRLDGGNGAHPALGKTHRMQLPVPIREQSDEIAAFAAEGFATVVCLPLRDASAAQKVDEERQSLLTETVPIVLFLDRIASFRIERINLDGSSETRVIRRSSKSVLGSPKTPWLSMPEVTVDRRRYLIASGTVEHDRFIDAVRRSIQEGQALEEWLKWDGEIRVSAAVPLSGDARSGRLYAFLPMDEVANAPFNGFVNAPFMPSIDRRSINPKVPLNAMLLDAAAESCAAACLHIASSNERRIEFVAAAVDFMAWSPAERGRIIAGFTKLGKQLNDAPVPISLQRATGKRWSTISEVMLWNDLDFNSLTDSFAVLPGQDDFSSLDDTAKLAFAKLAAAFLRDAPASIFTVQFTRDGTLSPLAWPSPILAFLKRPAWVPLRVIDDLHWAPPSACWYGSRSEPLPRFITRIDRALRDVLDSTENLVTTLVNPLGLQLWSVPQSAAARIKTLGECLNAGISEAERDSFRKEYREAWSDWSKLNPRPEINGDCTLAVDIAGRLIPLPCPETAPVVYISDGTDPMLHQLLSALDRPIFEAPSGSTEICADAVRRLVGRETRLLSDVDLRVEVDGQPFEASSVSSQLITPETEWLAEISTLVLELRDNLSNRNTLRARQALYDSLRRIRVCFAGHISVGIDGFSAPLPALLLGVLPMRHESFPSLIIERAERLDWRTLTRLGLGLSMLLDQVSLGNAFRLAFLALADQLEGREFEKPDDETVALAFQQPVERVREVYRSLRSNIQRTLRNLVPVVCLQYGLEAANDLRLKSERMHEDSEVAELLLAHIRPWGSTGRVQK